MSNNTRKLRLRGIVVATSIALAAQAAFAAGAQPAPRVDLSAIASDTQFDRFIVKYKDGTPEASSPAALNRSLQVASVNANQLVQAARLQKAGRGAPDKPLSASHVRRMSLGADVVASSQKLSAAEADSREDGKLSRMTTAFLANLSIEPVRNSRLVRVHFDSPDAAFSQRVVNAVAQAYIAAGFNVARGNCTHAVN